MNGRLVCSGILVGVGLLLTVAGVVLITYGMPTIIQGQVREVTL